jgi:hypothetical protein
MRSDLTSRAIGVAISGDRIAVHGRAEPDERLAAWDGSSSWPSLREVLVELRARSGATPRTALHIALFPDLTQLRTLSSSERRTSRLRRTLAREASTFFLDARAPQLVGLEPTESDGGGRRFVAVATPRALYDAIVSAATGAGFARVTIVPAHHAWGRAVRAELDARRDGPLTLVAPLERATIAMTIDARGRPISIRRAPASADWNELLDGISGDVIVPQLHREKIGASSTVRVIGSKLLGDPLSLAARGALLGTFGELVPEERFEATARRARRVMSAALVASAFALLVTGGARLWDLRREIAAVEAARTELRPRVVRALATRDSLMGIERDLAAVRVHEETAPRWSTLLESVATALPRTAMLTSLRGAADTVVVDGAASNASAVFEAMQRARNVAAVRSNAPVRQAFDSTRGPYEVFSFTLTTRRDSAGGVR